MRRLQFPHPMTLLVGCILLAMALSWILPAGEFLRRVDPATGRSVVVPGSYHAVPSAAVSPFRALVDIPKGVIDAAEVIFLVFLSGAAFTVVDHSGVLGRGVNAMVRALAGRTWIVIPVVSLLCAAGGVLIHMQEEFIAMVPVLLVLTRRIGYDAVVAVAVSVGAAAVGAAFSPIDPFMVGIAQKLAQLPLLSAAGYRLIFLPVALAIWIGGTLRYAARTRVTPGAAPTAPDLPGSVHLEAAEGTAATDDGAERMRPRDAVVLSLVVATFAVYVYGVPRLDWGLNEMAGLFFGMGIVAGLVGTRSRGNGAGLPARVPRAGVRRDPHRLRPGHLRRAAGRPDHRHDRQRRRRTGPEAAGDAVGACHDHRARRHPLPGAEHERAGGADDAGSPALGAAAVVIAIAIGLR
jgi:uncharacterized ion transporter superfamily protein YfcC